jgi:uncharacterized cupin superfamily protein
MEDAPGGKRPAGDGWFVVNAREAQWLHNERFGACATFEGSPRLGEPTWFKQLGINIEVVWPGQSNGYYHSEVGQEDFLVLSGECLLLIEGEERRLKAWDFVHCPPRTHHVFVGAGEGPCAILMVGARSGGVADDLRYPVDPVAARHGASVEQETTDPREAYARFSRFEPAPLPDLGLPWQ